MPRRAQHSTSQPNWSHLYEAAAVQGGYVTSRQALAAGYSGPLISYYVRLGHLSRPRRGIIRLSHFPAGEHEDLVVAWLWSNKEGVFSQQTALFLHGLTDVLPSKIHMTLPLSWKQRRLSLPPLVVLHFSDITEAEMGWNGPVPVTNPDRTIRDLRRAGAPDDLVESAVAQARARGLIANDKPGKAVPP
jgi:predicted transcriptional regulator of viral defense system